MTKADDDLIKQARKDFKRCEDWESLARTHFVDDMKFGNGDAYNQYQWENSIRSSREAAKKPMLTVNKTNVHCMHIVNDARQNKIGIMVRPVGGDATEKAADLLEGIIRHIEYRSKAQLAYDAAVYNSVFGGWGYIRVMTDYCDETSFNQDIFIKRVADPLTIYLDPDIQEYDGSDAKFGFVYENMLRTDFEAKYPQHKDLADMASFDGEDGWVTEDHVRVCEYWRKGEKTDELMQLMDGKVLLKSSIPPGMEDMLQFATDETGKPRSRKVATPEIEWFKIAGSKVLERRAWPGKYIPIARVIGQETVIDGRMDRKGHVRALMDPQRMYNYHTSGSVEFVAAQTKTPWLIADEAITDVDIWKRANLDTATYLPWKHIDENGNLIPKPERIQPPVAAGGHIEGMKVAQEEMMLVSGQYQAIMGEASNETSGKAINARQRQGENATYHFIDHLALAVTHVGRIVLDLIPYIYDTKRVLQIMGVDDSLKMIMIDPKAPQPAQIDPKAEDEDWNAEQVAAILNPNVGRYDVISDVGPSYGTQRQEAFNAFSQILAQNKEAFSLVGDLWADSADFPGADKMAKRLKNLVPSQAKGGPSPEMQAMQQQFQQIAQAGQEEIQQLQAALQEAQQKLKDQEADLERKSYEAQTARTAALGKIDPEAFKPVIREMVSQMMGEPIVPLMNQHAMADQARLPPPEPVGMESMTNGD